MSDVTTVEAILERAESRGREADLAYRGAVTPTEAWALVQSGKAKLVDTRTRFEWEYVGRVPDTTLIEWKRIPGGEQNPDFLAELGKVVDKDQPVLFLCRSGVRSHAAAIAATQAGYTAAFNILEGFEGDLDEHKQRGTRGGWRLAGLPWIQN